MASPLLDNLNPEQLAAVTLPHQSALILAGAGSGKTRVLTTRIAWLLATGQATPLSILAVTFTNKAAREMLLRLSAMTPVHTRGMWIGTFHGLCNRMLRAHYRDAGLPQLFQILDTQDQLSLIKRLYRAHGIDDERFPPRQLQQFIAGAKEEGRRPNQVEAGDDFDAPPGRALRAVRGDVPARGRGRLRRAAAAELRAARAARGPARALPAPLLAPAGRRVPGHQRAAVPLAAAARRAATPRCSPSATTTSRSTRSAARTSPTCSTSSATSAATACRCASSSSSRTTGRTATSSTPPTR